MFAQVLNGSDVLLQQGCQPLKGTRVGVITNHTGLTREGRPTWRALLDAGVKVTALFSPEHGFAGIVDEPVKDARHPETGLPIYSLYGEHKAPTAEMLRGVDALVFDIQDIGCRFYTYISTMGLAMEAAAQYGVRMLVLDRVNPINGVAVEGSLTDPDKRSFVAYHSIPLRHGMTVGELAKLFQAERVPRCDLQVIPCEGWKREMWYDQTGLHWVNPSPNMRSLTAATLYPGIGMLEFTNVSVGRGTDAPFELFGAPWLNANALAQYLLRRNLPGFACMPLQFTPNASKFANEVCHGLRFTVVDRKRFQPVRLGVEIACALRRLHPREWEHERLITLLTDGKAYEMIVRGADADEVWEHMQRQASSFRRKRGRYLLYE
ncbi:MAG: exo-beta-N-acetylmuramidase NamZ family protein [Armatimonadota bacterium]